MQYLFELDHFRASQNNTNILSLASKLIYYCDKVIFSVVMAKA